MLGVALAAWTSSKPFRAALDGGVPCGCELLHKAKRAPTDDERTVREEDARSAQEQWRCPRAGHPEPAADDAPLPADCLDTLQCAERVTALPVTQARTCPCWYAWQSLPRAACAERVWAERGADRDEMPAALVQAIGVLDAQLAERDAQQFEEHERRLAEAEASRPKTPSE